MVILLPLTYPPTASLISASTLQSRRRRVNSARFVTCHLTAPWVAHSRPTQHRASALRAQMLSGTRRGRISGHLTAVTGVCRQLATAELHRLTVTGFRNRSITTD